METRDGYTPTLSDKKPFSSGPSLRETNIAESTSFLFE